MTPRAALAALCACAGLALAAGCGDQSGSPIGYGDTTPTGGTFLFVDVLPADPFDPNVPGDTYDSTNAICFANVLDASAADGFRLYANRNEEGPRAVTDYIAEPQNSFSTGYKLFSLAAQDFDPNSNTEFVAHGARGGIESNVAAVSDHAYVPAEGGIALTRKTEIRQLAPIGTVETDTIPLLSWTAVPGATQYIVQIFNTNGPTYVVLVPGPTHRVQSQPAVFFQNVPLRANFFFQWVVLAVSHDNRIIGFTPTPEGFITRRPEP